MKYIAFFLAIFVLLYGSYSVSAIPLLDDSCASAIVVGMGSNTSGEISPAGDRDFYRIEAPSDGQVTVYTNSDMNTRGKLRDADCLEIASNSNSGPGLNFQMSEQVSQGVYYIEVYNSSTSETGSYALYVEGDFANDDHGNSCTSATTLESYNSMDSGQLSVYADHDFFKVVKPKRRTFHGILSKRYEPTRQTEGLQLL